MWERLDGRTPGSEVVRAIVQQFEVSEEKAATGYVELIAQLRSIEALVEAAPSG